MVHPDGKGSIAVSWSSEPGGPFLVVCINGPRQQFPLLVQCHSNYLARAEWG